MAITVRVPATTANIGPGFDCLGAALTLYNQFTFSELPIDSSHKLEITVKGINADRVSRNADNIGKFCDRDRRWISGCE